MEKLWKHKEAPQDAETHKDSDGGDRDSLLGGEGHGGGSRDVALTHYVVADGSCWGERWEGGMQGGGGLACTGLQTRRLILHPGRSFGQLPDATTFGTVTTGRLD